jgi:hypothetical protein
MGTTGQSNGNAFLLPFSNASDWCRALGAGRRLVTVETEEKHQAVLKFVMDHEYNSDAIWIGGGLKRRNQWMWINGSVFTGENTPSESVVILCDIEDAIS